MKWVLFVVAAMVLVVGAVAGIGAKLPVNHRASRRARFRQSPENLYAALAGPPDWRSEVKAWGALPPSEGRQQWWEQDSHGKKVTFELVEDRPPARRAVRIADKNLPFGGTWTFEIAPADGGSELRITEDGEVYNVIFRFMSKYVFGYTGSIEGFFRDLGKKFGEQPQTED
jgi:hypothetical protein